MAVPVVFAGPSERGRRVFSSRCLSLGPHVGPPVSFTSISTSLGTPLTTLGTLMVFFFAGWVVGSLGGIELFLSRAAAGGWGLRPGVRYFAAPPLVLAAASAASKTWG